MLFRSDADEDTVPDGCDICPEGDDFVDTDEDATPDACDAFPNDDTESLDSDGDGIGDNADTYPNDRDNDGVNDDIDDDIDVAPGTAGAIAFAISIANDGDVIQLEAGTYTEGAVIDTLGKALTLRGVPDADGDGLAETILDGQCSHRLLQCTSGENAATVFQHLVVQNGNASDDYTGDYDDGGGLYVESSSPSLINCAFIGCFAEDWGGAAYLKNSNSSFTNCTFRKNFAYQDGGAAYLLSGSPNFENCAFEQNATSSDGGGLYLRGSGITTVTSSTFRANLSVRGGAIAVLSGVDISDCIFDANSTYRSGSAISVSSSSTIITSSSFTANSITSERTDVGAIYSSDEIGRAHV